MKGKKWLPATVSYYRYTFTDDVSYEGGHKLSTSYPNILPAKKFRWNVCGVCNFRVYSFLGRHLTPLLAAGVNAPSSRCMMSTRLPLVAFFPVSRVKEKGDAVGSLLKNEEVVAQQYCNGMMCAPQAP